MRFQATEPTRERSKKVDKKASKLLRKSYNNLWADKSSDTFYRFILYVYIFNQLILATSEKEANNEKWIWPAGQLSRNLCCATNWGVFGGEWQMQPNGIFN